MTEFVTSEDGTRIAFDRTGAGPPVVLVGGMFCARPATAALAEALGARCTVIGYDRRGRGESGAGGPYAVAREVEDLAALLDEVGGGAAVYGHSSGAGLALHAAAAGLPVHALVLHEPPYGGDDDESVASSRALAADVAAAIREDRRADAIARFLGETGMPAQAVAATSHDPGMLAVAPTMVHDLEVMGDADGGRIPVDLAARITVATLVLAGSASPPFFLDAARRLAAAIPGARLEVLDGHDHGAPADAVAPAITRFLDSVST